MRIAFLFSGQYRYVPHELLKLSIANLTKGINYGIFCYAWDEPGISLDHQDKIPDIFENKKSKLIIKRLFKEFNLIDIKTEKFKDFPKKISKQHKTILNAEIYHKGTIHSLPQIYSLSECYKLFLPHKDNYDMVFRCRFDSLFIHPLNVYPLDEIINSNILYNINFGRAYYPKRIYDIFFGGSKTSMEFLGNIWDSIPNLVNHNFNNKQDKRDACRILFLSANLNNIECKSLRTRICDIYRPTKNNYYEDYLISSHLVSLSINNYSFKVFIFFKDWLKKRRIRYSKIISPFLRTLILLPISYLKRIRYFF